MCLWGLALGLSPFSSMKATVSQAGRIRTKSVDKEEHGMEGYAAPVWSLDSAADERPQRKHLI